MCSTDHFFQRRFDLVLSDDYLQKTLENLNWSLWPHDLLSDSVSTIFLVDVEQVLICTNRDLSRSGNHLLCILSFFISTFFIYMPSSYYLLQQWRSEKGGRRGRLPQAAHFWRVALRVSCLNRNGYSYLQVKPSSHYAKVGLRCKDDLVQKE